MKKSKSDLKCPDCGEKVMWYHGLGERPLLSRAICKKNCSNWKIIMTVVR